MQVSAAILIRGSASEVNILSARRTEPPHLAGRWELPGGQVDPGETIVEALHREIQEELNVDIEILHYLQGPLANDGWPLTSDKILHAHICRIRGGVEPVLNEQHDAYVWLALSNITDVDWLEPDIPILENAIEWITHNV
jgi:8-oxo-dGTP diphosphatase